MWSATKILSADLKCAGEDCNSYKISYFNYYMTNLNKIFPNMIDIPTSNQTRTPTVLGDICQCQRLQKDLYLRYCLVDFIHRKTSNVMCP